MLFKSILLALLATTTVHASFFVITEQISRNVKCFQSYNDIGLIERSICWHDKEFYSDRWHDWPCEVDCEVDVPVRIYLEDYTYPSSHHHPSRRGGPGSAFTYQELQELQESGRGASSQRAMVRSGKGGGGDRRSIFKVYIQRLDSEWQLVTYLRKGTGECKNEHDEEGWSIWACAEIKTI